MKVYACQAMDCARVASGAVAIYGGGWAPDNNYWFLRCAHHILLVHQGKWPMQRIKEVSIEEYELLMAEDILEGSIPMPYLGKMLKK